MTRAALLLLLLLGCGPHDAESADLLGPRPPPLQPCISNGDCSADAFCEFACGEAHGFCKPRFMCMVRGGEVCGCDGVTYANDCDRRAAGVSGFTPGACP